VIFWIGVATCPDPNATTCAGLKTKTAFATGSAT
jgi:hypothetical protein